MDSEGLATIDFIFVVFLSLIVSLSILNLFQTNLNNEKIIEEEVNSRIFLDKIANSINQVNSNGLGNSKEIYIENPPNSRSYYFIVKSNEVIITYVDKKGESSIFPVRLVNLNKESVSEIRINKGESYKIRKVLDNDNLTAIQIFKE